MVWQVPLGRVRGTEIRMHLTLLLLLAWYAWQGWRVAGVGGAVDQFAFLVLLFASVTLHEFGHITAARRYGIATPTVLLTPIGGLAQIARMPANPRQELVIALAGPLVTLVLTLLLVGGLVLAGDAAALLPGTPDDVPLWTSLAWANLILLVFNLIPAFPMDGGRVLRALLAGRIGMVRGTRIAVRVGQALAIGLAVVGVMTNPMLALIALFIFLGAEAELTAVANGMMDSLMHTVVAEAQFVTPGQSLRDVLAKAGGASPLVWPVVDADGRLLGCLTRADLATAADTGQLDTSVAHHLRPLTDCSYVCLDRPITAIDPTEWAAADATLPLIDATGRYLGMVYRDRFTDQILAQGLRRPDPSPTPRPS